MVAQRDNLLDLCQSLGLVVGTQAVASHEHCACASICWKGHESRFPKGDRAHISLPWVGDRYDSTRILVVGENLNGDGGLDELDGREGLVESAMAELLQGRVRVRFGNDYKQYVGSFPWHHAAVYSAVLVRRSRADDDALVDPAKIPAEEIANSYRSVSFLNHVKCAPTGDRSHPSPEMWQRCGAHILAKELAILKPKVVLALGKSENGPRLRRLLQAQARETSSSELTWVSRTQLASPTGPLDLFVVPHPSYYRAPWAEVAAEMARI